MTVPRGPFTDALVAANILLWLIGWLTGQAGWISAIAGFLPLRITGDAAYPAEIGMVPAWLTPLTSAFVHQDFFHLLTNMLVLLLCGRFVEMAIGGRALLLLYAVGAYAAAAAHLLSDWSGTALLIGASGAGSAVIGAYMLLFAGTKARGRGRISAEWMRMGSLLLLWVLLNVAIGISGAFGSNIAVVAHIGGFIAGLLLARPLVRVRYRSA